MKTPNDHSTLEEVVKYLHSKDYEVTNPAYAYFARTHNTTPQALYSLAYNQEPDTDGIEMHLLTPNKVYKPLSLEQKEEVYKHHTDHKTALLATLYNTNRQNIILAKRGEHRQQHEQPDYSTVTPVTPSERYGPLTTAQKLEIYTNHQDVPPKALAGLYNTNHQNVRIAQKTKHHGKATTADMRLVSKIKLTGSVTWADRTYIIIEALNNDPTLIDEVLYYISIGERMPHKVIDVCIALGGDVPHSIVADSMYAAQRIAYALANDMLDYLKELCIAYDCKTTLNALKNEHLTEENLEPLYMSMTEMSGDMRSLVKAIRAEGVEVHNETYKVFDNNPFEEQQ